MDKKGGHKGQRRHKKLSQTWLTSNLSRIIKIKKNPVNTTPITQTSHACKVLDCFESFPIVMLANTHINMVNFDAQI